MRQAYDKPTGGTHKKIRVGGREGPLTKTLTLFMTKICDIPYPIYDLSINSKPYSIYDQMLNSKPCFRPALLSYLVQSNVKLL